MHILIALSTILTTPLPCQQQQQLPVSARHPKPLCMSVCPPPRRAAVARRTRQLSESSPRPEHWTGRRIYSRSAAGVDRIGTIVDTHDIHSLQSRQSQRYVRRLHHVHVDYTDQTTVPRYSVLGTRRRRRHRTRDPGDTHHPSQSTESRNMCSDKRALLRSHNLLNR